MLVKWWLLALPHYLVLSSSSAAGYGPAPTVQPSSELGAGGLLGLLVLIAAVALLFTARYPRSLYALIVGIDRWSLRVAAYAGLMTDAYPPFRLDQGGTDPGPVPASPAPAAPLVPRGLGLAGA